jgi:NDP-sugar pyrophosphorylase family protein
MHFLELFFELTGFSHQRTIKEDVFELIGFSHQRTIEEDVLPDLIYRKLESAMGEILAEKMGEKFLDAESSKRFEKVRKITLEESCVVDIERTRARGGVT